MKLTRKILVAALAVLMLMSMATTAFAAGGTITVTGDSDTTYTVYKMFDIIMVNDTKTYKPTTDWEAFLDKPNVNNYLVKIANGYVSWNTATAKSEANTAALAQLAKDYVNSAIPALSSVATVIADGTDTPTANLDNGYYLLMSDKGSSGVTAIYNNNVTVVDKNSSSAPGLPKVSKTVQEDSNSNWGDANTADIGQTINFETVITANEGATNYTLHDKMDAGLTFGAITKIDVNGVALTKDAFTNGYTVSTTTGDDCDFHVIFTEDVLTNLHDNDKITINYTASLNKYATAGTAQVNTTWLTHSATDAKTLEDTTTSTTYELGIIKKDEKGNELAGAGFVLKNGDKFYKVDSSGNVTWVDDIETATVQTSDADGKLSFNGIDADTYTLVESVVPAGYVQAENKTIALGNNMTTEITNKLGEPLPETGGIGTTIFYVLGGVLAAGALVLLITKKRMSSAE